MSIYKKLTSLQCKLKAPKGQFNKFGKYRYRNCEDILEAVKPLLMENGLSLFVSDEIKHIGDRYYISATATLVDFDNPDEKITATALARESENKKGMDDSQITGAASSYARKYCLNGLFAIDDTKDSDSMDNNQQPTPPALVFLNQDQQNKLRSSLTEIHRINPQRNAEAGLLKALNCQNIESIQQSQFGYAMGMLVKVLADAKSKAGAA